MYDTTQAVGETGDGARFGDVMKKYGNQDFGRLRISMVAGDRLILALVLLLNLVTGVIHRSTSSFWRRPNY